MAEKGSLSINSENMFPIIKKWLYSDHDIFYRALISNGCDAITKLKKLDMMGDFALPEDYKARIDIEVSPTDKTIKVSDNGIGMNKDELNDLFQIDKLNSRPGTNKEAGTGLGLIVCHDFVEKHGGTITVETEEDLGTTFEVKIPFARYINKNA